MSTPLTMDDVVVHSPDQVSAHVANEAIILGLRNGVYYGVDQTALRIWDLVRTPVHVRTVVDTLCAEFDVDAARCAAEVLTFLQTLETKGLVARVADQPPS